MVQALIAESTKDREIILLEHEINEINAADIKLGADEALEDEYKRLNNFSRIGGGLSKAYGATSEEGAADCILKAVSELKAIEAYDDRAASLLSMLLDVEAILSDFNREVSSILDDDSFDEGRFREIEQRLNEINR